MKQSVLLFSVFHFNETGLSFGVELYFVLCFGYLNVILPVAVEGLGSSSAGQQGALSVGSHSSVSRLALRNGLLGL